MPLGTSRTDTAPATTEAAIGDTAVTTAARPQQTAYHRPADA